MPQEWEWDVWDVWEEWDFQGGWLWYYQFNKELACRLIPDGRKRDERE